MKRRIDRAMLAYAEARRREAEPDTRGQWELAVAHWRQRVFVHEVNDGPPHSVLRETKSETNGACLYCGKVGNGAPCDPFCGADNPRHQHSQLCYDYQGLPRCGRVAGVDD